jgi:hypothetical protein
MTERYCTSCDSRHKPDADCTPEASAAPSVLPYTPRTNSAPPIVPHEPREHATQFFTTAHLPPHLAEVSRRFAELADYLHSLPRNPERTKAIDKLLESKDCAVRTVIAKW